MSGASGLIIGKFRMILRMFLAALSASVALAGCSGVSDGGDGASPGLQISPGTVMFSENSGSGSFSVNLATAPNDLVVVDVVSTDESEVVVQQSSLTFTPGIWSSPQHVLLNGIDDDEIDGNQICTITLTINTESTKDTTGYRNVGNASLEVTVLDDDQPGVTVAPSTLTFSENGETVDFNVRLNTIPNGDVVIGIANSRTSEATVDQSFLTFTAENWNLAQIVTVTGLNDFEIDGNQTFPIEVKVNTDATTDTTGYAELESGDVTITVLDDDVAGVAVTPTTLLAIPEINGSETFEVRLNTVPDEVVVISVVSSDTSEATVDKGALTFTPENWSVPQPVTVSGVDDLVADGNQTFFIQVNVDKTLTRDTTGYQELEDAAVSDVQVTVSDEKAAVTVTPGTTVFSEKDGRGSFLVELNSMPDGDVVIAIESPDESEATVEPLHLIFNEDNWQTRQTVLVPAVDDDLVDGNQTFYIKVNIDKTQTTDTTGYLDLGETAVDDVRVTVIDDDKAGVTVTPSTPLTFSENGGSASFTLRLNSQPDGQVTILVESKDISEATVDNGSLIFGEDDWSNPRTVTISAIDDFEIDGNQTFDIVVNVDQPGTTDTTGYADLAPGEVADVRVTVTDDDTAGVTMTPTALTFSENGESDFFEVWLNTIPDGAVVVDVISRDESEATVDQNSLAFDPLNWSTPQRVAVSGVNDDEADGSQTFNVQLSINGQTADTTGYKTVAVDDVQVTVTDDDVAGVRITPTELPAFSENGGSASFKVRLNTRPRGEVVLSIDSQDHSEARVNPTILTFSDIDWSTQKTVIVSGVDDLVDDGNQTVAIDLDISVDATTDTTGYKSVSVTPVPVTVTDDDTAAVTVTPGTTTFSENEGVGSFTVALNTQPVGVVKIAVTSLDESEAAVDPALLTFDSVNWETAQTVRIDGVNDDIDDGNQSFNIQVDVDPSTTDALYQGLAVNDVPVTVQDDDTAAVTVTPGTTTFSEAGGEGSFTVVLNTQPVGTVNIAVTSLDDSEAAVDPNLLIFDSVNWGTGQTVNITGVDDLDPDGEQTVVIAVDVLHPDTTALAYSSLPPEAVADVTVTVTDDEGAPPE